MNIYVSNLGPGVQSEDLKKIFDPYGIVSSATVINDKQTGRSRGFGFVEMKDEQAANKAIRDLDGCMLQGQSIKMNKAREKERRPNGSSLY